MNPETLLERYARAKREVVDLQNALPVVEHEYRVTKARTETSAIENAGGEKQLGPNESSRDRALILACEQDGICWAARDRVFKVSARLREAEAELDCIKFEMRLYEASLKGREIRMQEHDRGPRYIYSKSYVGAPGVLKPEE